ncbi:methyl-accepting chemotaxis protein [Ramlibacter sp.]|uniref:methyl-accepting chemotaxis protein n=1 Tax=Ramlibacter sp. TaxID=1917967 RepID=UPI00257F37C8|nr:methyl-accepting chemotaxis protein [Ramlibacter sp.]
MLTSVALLVAALALTSFIATTTAARQSRELVTRWLDDKVKSVAESVDAFDATSRVMAERAYNGFRQALPGSFALDAGAGVLRHEGKPLNGRFDEVDAFNRSTGGVATIFMRRGEDFVRIATNVKQQNGERAVGTLLARNSPAYPQMMAGKRYVGRAVLFGTPFMTVYDPVRDAAGNVVGILFIGFDISDFQRSLEGVVKNSRFFDTGGTYVIDPRQSNADAVFVSHPSAAGKKVLEVEPGADAFLTRLRAADEVVALDATPLFAGSGKGEAPWAVKRSSKSTGWWVVAEVPEAEAMAAHRAGMRILWGLLAACAVLMGLALGLLVRRQVSRPLAELGAAVDRLAEGDLRHPFSYARADEVGALVERLETMRQRFGAMIAQLRGASDSIRVASTEIAAGHQDLSTRTEHTAGNLQQTAASMQQLAGTVNESAASAGQASELATQSAGIARRGGEVVQSVVATMAGMGESSRRISDITGVIDSIAFQTNILALNAAVEAARAGDQGRGFAVVASEVRALAQRSGEAAREIRALIGETVERVQAGTGQVQEAGAAMKDIVDAADRVAAMIARISAAAAEQSSGLASVNQAVSQLDEATQQNAALVEQGTAAAHSLHAQSAGLVEVVAKFRTEETAG